MNERVLTVLVPIKSSDATTVSTLPPASADNINVIYRHNGVYKRSWLNPSTNQYEYREVVDREFPYIGKPLEIIDFTYEATRMGQAPTISADSVMWGLDKDANNNYITLDNLWTQDCHVIFNGETFYLAQIPTSKKSDGDARYQYTINWTSGRVVLEHIYLYDVVQPFVSTKPISESAEFSFYGDIEELAKRINASLIRSGLATLEYRDGVTADSFLTYEEFNSVGLGTYTGDKDYSDPYPEIGGQHEVHKNIYEHFGGNYTRYLLNLVYQVDGPQSIHIGPASGGYNEIYNGSFKLSGYKCLIGKNEKGVLTTSEEKLIYFDKKTIYEALQEFHDTFGLQYYIYSERSRLGSFTGNTIIMVGDCQHDFADMNNAGTDYVRNEEGIPTSTHPFDYGVNDALLSKEKTNTTDKIITRITGAGSEENIPWYYPNPNPDGWLKPVYKRAGRYYALQTVDYPKSEGKNVWEYARYEKYIKNRIGNKIQWGQLQDIILNFSEKMTTAGEESGVPYFHTFYFFEGLESEYFRFTVKCNLLNQTQSNYTKFVAKLYFDSDTQFADIYDSSQRYFRPSPFKQAFMAGDGTVAIPLSGTHKYCHIAITVYLSQIPPTTECDDEGYRYAKQQVSYTRTPYNRDGCTHRYSGSGYIPEDFYAKDGLVPLVTWEEYGSPAYRVKDGRSYCDHTMRVQAAYRTTDGTGATIETPMRRSKGRRYKDITTGKIYECTTSEQPIYLSHYPLSGLYLDGYSVDPLMKPVEWFNSFFSMELRTYIAKDWYLKGKKIDLVDYGIVNEFSDSYEPLLTQPRDWSLRYASYYTKSGDAYVPVPGSTAPSFEPGTYYVKHNSLDYGGGSDYVPTIFDTIEFQRVKYVTPQSRLMPELYIKTDGERRFYNAHNYYPLDKGTPDEAVGEMNLPGSIEIVNPLYKGNMDDPDDKHYQFESEYVQQAPHEHIEEFDDIKPSIKGQTNTVNGQTFRIDVVEEFAFDELDNNEVWENNDDGNVSGEYKHPFIFAKLRPLGFNIFDLALQEDMIISMTTGHCGACNFKIGVDENTKKNPVQIWEYDVYKGSTYATKGTKIYSAGDLRRVTDSSVLYYDTTGDEDGYIPVDPVSENTEGFLVDASDDRGTGSGQYERETYSGEQVANGEVGSLKQTPKKRFDGDVVVSGRFIDSQQDTSENYVWVALYKDTDTYGVVMPFAQPDYGDGNYSHYIDPRGHKYTDRKTGEVEYFSDDDADEFVFVNIKMPQIYFRRAERELSRKIVAYMYDNNYQKFNFSIGFSRIFLAENSDIDGKLNENSVLYVMFNNRIYRQYVKHYVYKVSHDEPIPEISVDMNEELSVSRTAAENQAVHENAVVQNKVVAMRKEIDEAINAVKRKAIGRNDDIVFSGNLVNLGSKSSISDVNKRGTKNAAEIEYTKNDLNDNHFKKVDFEVLNGTDLSIGGGLLLLPTAFQRGQRMIRRKWDTESMKLVEDNDQTFAPAFIDNANKRFVQTGYVGVGGSTAPTFAQNTYYKFENGIYTLLDEQPPNWTTDWRSYYKEGVSIDLVPARVNDAIRGIVWGNNEEEAIVPIEIGDNEIYRLNTIESEDLSNNKAIKVIKQTVEKRFEENQMAANTPTCGNTESIATVSIDEVKYLFWVDENGNDIRYNSGGCQHDDPFTK